MMKKKKSVSIVDTSDYEINTIKKSLKKIFSDLGYPEKNPLGSIVKPGMTVFIKPNWVASRWRESCAFKGDLYSIITHPNVIEAVADFVAEALQGKGKIIIGDNPSIDADFNELMQTTKIKKLEKKYNVDCEIIDLRNLICTDLKYYGKKDKMVKQEGDSLGVETINLGKRSLLSKVNSKLFRGVFDEREETVQSHTKDTQVYSFSKSLYDADVYISIPKLKTHHKVGATLNLKGLVGAICVKNELVHWRIGFPAIGGDEYPNFISWFKSFFVKTKERGAWDGNDTIWRMVVDLYYAMNLRKRKYFTIIDGIMGGEGKGPFNVFKKDAKVLLGSEDLLSADVTAVRLMGFDPKEITYLNYFISNDKINYQDIKVINNSKIQKDFFNKKDKYLDYLPPENWKNIKIGENKK